MVARVDYSKLVNTVGSKYKLCILAAKRAEQLVDNMARLRRGKSPVYESELVDEIGKSPLYIALREIEEGLIYPVVSEEKEELKAEKREVPFGELTFETDYDMNLAIENLDKLLEEIGAEFSSREEQKGAQVEFLEKEKEPSLEEAQERELEAEFPEEIEPEE